MEKDKDSHISNGDFYEISGLPLSVRAINCLKEAKITSLSELLTLNEADFLSMRNMGVKTCMEILNYIRDASLLPLENTKSYCLENINNDNKGIPIDALKNLNIMEEGIKTLLENGYEKVEDLGLYSMSPQVYAIVRPIAEHLKTSAITHFKTDVNSLSANAKTCIIKRSYGSTLQEIGDEIGVSRERVRQITAKACVQLQKSANLIASILFSSNNNAFTFTELQHIIPDEQTARCCRLVLLESEYVRHFKFSDKYIHADICPADVDLQIEDFVREIIAEGFNFNDNIEVIEAELKKAALEFFDFEDIMNYLVVNGYHFYGEYVTKGKQPYSNICCDAIKKFFIFDIKLDSHEDNEDMKLLRRIISKHYQGLTLPASNRAVTVAVTRDATKIVLSGRGRYCPIEKVEYNISLFDEVRNFIHKSSQTSFYYSELYSHFEDRFLSETNIHNFNFFHGMMKCIFPNEFTYERDLLTKNGSPRRNIDARLSELLKKHGSAMTKAEIRKSIPGINDFVFAFSSMRLPEIIQWEYNEYNHIDNIKILPEDLHRLQEIIESQMDKHRGYCSEYLLFEQADKMRTQFLEKNHILNAQNLYYIADYYFNGSYRFRRPHIVAGHFPVRDLSVENIVRVLLCNKEGLNYEKYYSLAESLGWSEGRQYAVFTELEKEYIRISSSDYVHKDYFSLKGDTIKSVSKLLNNELKNSDYYSFSNINYNRFPKFDYPWNGFLLESIITEYDIGFRIIYPQTKARRYLSGIIVPYNSEYKSFEDLVVGTLIKHNIHSVSEAELEKFLRLQGIITKNLLKEIYDYSRLSYKNELFSVV